MTLTEQAKRFRQLADYIESQPKEQFDQRIFFHSCGTPACIAGHCVVMLEEQKICDKYYMMPAIIATRWLGIDVDDGLFSMFAPWQTQKEAVEELRRRANEIEKRGSKMTLDEFFALLPKDGWKVNKYNSIRHVTTSECPICFIANQHFGSTLKNIEWRSAATIINLPQDIASQLVNAADFYSILDNELRQKLLDHFGLTDTLRAD